MTDARIDGHVEIRCSNAPNALSDRVPKNPIPKKTRTKFLKDLKLSPFSAHTGILTSTRNFLDQPYISRIAQNRSFRILFYLLMLTLCLFHLPLPLNDCLASEDLHYPGDAGDLPLEGESVQFLCFRP